MSICKLTKSSSSKLALDEIQIKMTESILGWREFMFVHMKDFFFSQKGLMIFFNQHAGMFFIDSPLFMNEMKKLKHLIFIPYQEEIIKWGRG